MALQTILTLLLIVSSQAAHDPDYDFVIIGAGSGGSVLANRLSEVDDWRVLLLEAGGEEIFLTDIPLLAPLMHITDYNWGYRTEPSREQVS